MHVTLAALLILHACSSDSPTGASQPEDTFIAGVNVSQLFAPPTADEVAAIQNDWSARRSVATDVQIVSEQDALLGATPAILRIISYRLDGLRLYGMVLYPQHAAESSLPVLVYTHGGDSGFSGDEFQLVVTIADDKVDQYVYVAPSYRAEPLVTDGGTFHSDGPASPWDRDVDDTIALLDITLAQVPAADPERVGMLGFSRGATVAMLAAIRDPRMKSVVAFFGPTDFLGEFAQTVFEDALSGQPRELPGVDYLNENYIIPLKNGEITIADTRLEMIRRSPVYFADQLPPLQIHHGTADLTVPVSESERLIAVMDEIGRSAPDFESYLYPGGTHNPLTLPGSLLRASQFLNDFFISAQARYAIVPSR